MNNNQKKVMYSETPTFSY